MTESGEEILAGLRLSHLDTRLVGRHIEAKPLVASTNNLALRHGDHGTVFLAEQQLAGRGRHGNTWHAPPGLGLMFSVALDMPSRDLMFAGALAVRDAIRPQLELTVKWPNDLLYAKKKICGILVEHRAGRSALGIGFNVLHGAEDFPPSLQDKATSLRLETNCDWDRGEVLARLLRALDHYIERVAQGHSRAVHAEWVQACALVGRHITREQVSGQVREIARDGALLIETLEGLRRVTAGGIQVADQLGAS